MTHADGKACFIGFKVSNQDMQRLNEILRRENVTASAYLRKLLHKAFEKEGV